MKIHVSKLSIGLLVGAIVGAIGLPTSAGATTMMNGEPVYTQSNSQYQKQTNDDQHTTTCQKRQQSLQNRLSRSSDRARQQIDSILASLDRALTRYVEEGGTIPDYDYDQLFNDMVTKLSAANVAVSNTVATGSHVTTTCSGNHHQTMSDEYKAAVKEQQAAMKELKTSVKNVTSETKSHSHSNSDSSSSSTQDSSTSNTPSEDCMTLDEARQRYSQYTSL